MEIIDKSNIPKTSKQMYVAVIDGALATNLRAFYAQIAAQLHFPDYFGKNLDALVDCLRSLDAIEQDEVLLVIKNHKRFLVDASPTKRKMVAEILHNAALPDNRDDEKVFRTVKC